MGVLAATLVLLAQAAQPQVDDKRIQELVAKYGSEDIAEREAATRDLYALGEGAVPALEKAAAGLKGEARARLDRIVSELTMPARWAKEITEGDWNTVYQKLEQSLRSKELEGATAVRVFSAALLHDAATSQLRQGLLEIASRHKLRDIWPVLLQLISREDSMYENYGHYLQQLRPPREAAGAILKAVPKLQNFNMAYQLMETARSLRPERAAVDECLTAVLEGDDTNLKANVMSWLQQGRWSVSFKTILKWWRDYPQMRPHQVREILLRSPPGDSVNDVVELLRSNSPEDNALAVEYIGRQRVLAAAPALARALEERPELRASILQSFRNLRCETELRSWIAGPEGPGRRVALVLAGELAWVSAAPEVVRCLDDSDAGVRREAAAAAGPLRMLDQASKLEAMVQDSDGGVRRGALLSLAMLRRRDATKAVLAGLKSEDPDLQAASVEALPYIDVEQALAALTSDEALSRAYTRYALAVLIVKNGGGMLHRVMARVHGKISPDEMNAQIRLVQNFQAGPVFR